METITEAQLSGWLEWAKIRGPVGGPRRDWYYANLAYYSGKPLSKDAMPDDLLPYWALREAEMAKTIAAEAKAALDEDG